MTDLLVVCRWNNAKTYETLLDVPPDWRERAYKGSQVETAIELEPGDAANLRLTEIKALGEALPELSLEQVVRVWRVCYRRYVSNDQVEAKINRRI